MKWFPAEKKPPGYKKVLLELVGDEHEVGHYADNPNKWIGFAGNQSPPYYEIEYSLVLKWCFIETEAREQIIEADRAPRCSECNERLIVVGGCNQVLHDCHAA